MTSRVVLLVRPRCLPPSRPRDHRLGKLAGTGARVQADGPLDDMLDELPIDQAGTSLWVEQQMNLSTAARPHSGGIPARRMVASSAWARALPIVGA